jgi:hypothetical protein
LVAAFLTQRDEILLPQMDGIGTEFGGWSPVVVDEALPAGSAGCFDAACQFLAQVDVPRSVDLAWTLYAKLHGAHAGIDGRLQARCMVGYGVQVQAL